MDNENQSQDLVLSNLDLMEIDLICFSHLRWNFVFQRPQQLMVRFAKQQRVFYFEDPTYNDTDHPYLLENVCASGVKFYSPNLPLAMSEEKTNETLRYLLNELMVKEKITNFISWYYSPLALKYSEHLNPKTIVYDCIEEFSLLESPHTELLKLEGDLFKKTEVVFTAGISLYEAKKNRHRNIHSISSSIDREHFSSCSNSPDPADQVNIPHPRIGFYGVVDERLDLVLLSSMADILFEWQIIIIGPIEKIDPNTLPKQPNIHYLGKKDYKELPCYLNSWDVAMLPFAKTQSKRFISPTKISEYLAAGKPVVSTPIKDVVRPYAEMGLVYIAADPELFAENAKMAYISKENLEWKMKADRFLTQNSWDNIWNKMNSIIALALQTDTSIEYKLKDAPISEIKTSATNKKKANTN